MTRFFLTPLSCALAAAVSACSPPADRSGVALTRLDSAGLGQARAAFQRTVLLNDASRLAGFYADSAALLVAGLPTIRGRAAIERFFGQALATTRFESFEFEPVLMTGRGGVVSEVGRQQDVSRAAGKAAQAAYGRYMITWVRSAQGEWRMMMDATVIDSIRPVAPDRAGAAR